MKRKNISLLSLKNLFWIALVILALPLTIFLLFQNTDNRQKAAEDVVIQVIPDQLSVEANQKLQLIVNITPLSSPVKSAFLSLTYPQDKFDIVAVTHEESPFTETIEQLTSQGLIKIGLETNFPVTKSVRFVTITLQSKEAVMASEIKGALDSYAVDLNNERLTTTVTLDATSQLPASQDEGLSVQSLLTLVTSFFNRDE